jgi:catechol 2,3-dioxygenase-like lactoylglutathione lyase family enzyme
LGSSGLQVERVDFVAVPVLDLERGREFYGGTLGLRPNPLAHGTFPEYETGNVTLTLVSPAAIGREFEPLPFGAVSLRVPDVEAARLVLEEAGVAFEGDTYDSSVCHMAFFRDPDGNGLILHHRYAPYADGSAP